MSFPLNRLAREKSIYLRQHARNPVNWFPWSEEAFTEAAAKDKPVFLSIGYSACHWCHVMERESFEDPDVAALLNRSFVAVKVDREERPDLDHFYMDVCQKMTGGGGWPLTIVLAPDRTAFFAGTYFPKISKYGRPGLLEILPRLIDLWTTRRAEVLSVAARITAAKVLGSEEGFAELPGVTVLHEAFEALAAEFDKEEGGFGAAPKFPTAHHLLFLLRYAKRSGTPEALRMVETTLIRMRQGGIFDQLGSGFHRYSTDRAWRVPHFEKMLYDQALIALAYTEAYQASGNALFREAAEETLAYVERDMTSGEGGYFASEDADVEGEEGKFYLWSAAQIREALAPAEADLAIRLFGLKARGSDVLHPGRPLDGVAAEIGLEFREMKKRAEKIRADLLAARHKRTRPDRDTKVLADWNGLMIAAQARASQAFDEPRYAVAAAKAADFVLDRMRGPHGALLHRWIDGEARIPGFLDDYAFMTWGLLELYEAVFTAGYLEKAIALCRFALEHFWDEAAGGFYFTSDREIELPERRKEFIDGAYPSGNSVMALNLIRLGQMTGDGTWGEKADRTLKAFFPLLSRAPQASTFALTALDFAVGPSSEIVLVGRPDSSSTAALLHEIRRPFLPNKVVLMRRDGDDPEIVRLAPFLKAMTALRGRSSAYVCSSFSCRAPASDPQELRRQISAL